MARERLIPTQNARDSGVTVSWSLNGRRHHQCGINLSSQIVKDLGLEAGHRVRVDRCIETNRVWLSKTTGTDGWAINWKVRPTSRSAQIRLPLPGIYGEKRPAVPCEHRMTAEGDLEISMPEWAQPPSARRAAAARAGAPVNGKPMGRAA
jgi:hypothetical protein